MTNINNVNIYSGPDPEDLVVCPFDETHVIRHKRFPYHLIECRRHYQGDERVQCPFNARHWILLNQYPFHKATCSDRYQIEQDIAFQPSQKKKLASTCENSDSVPMTEDWDDDERLRRYVESRMQMRAARARSKSASRASSSSGASEARVLETDQTPFVKAKKSPVNPSIDRSVDTGSLKSVAIDDGFNTTRPPQSESLSLKGISVRPSYDRGKADGKDDSAAKRHDASPCSLVVASPRQKRDDDDDSRSACTLVAAASAEKAFAISASNVDASAVSSEAHSVAASGSAVSAATRSVAASGSAVSSGARSVAAAASIDNSTATSAVFASGGGSTAGPSAAAPSAASSFKISNRGHSAADSSLCDASRSSVTLFGSSAASSSVVSSTTLFGSSDNGAFSAVSSMTLFGSSDNGAPSSVGSSLLSTSLSFAYASSSSAASSSLTTPAVRPKAFVGRGRGLLSAMRSAKPPPIGRIHAEGAKGAVDPPIDDAASVFSGYLDESSAAEMSRAGTGVVGGGEEINHFRFRKFKLDE